MADQLIEKLTALKSTLEELQGTSLVQHELVMEETDVLQLDFSERFRQAVEARQVAEQDAGWRGQGAAKARRLAAA